jgi:SAV_6107-like HEPN
MTMALPVPGLSAAIVPQGGARRGRAPSAAGRRLPGPRTAPATAPTSQAALALLRQAADGLAEAHREDDPLLRYPAAYLAALRGGAAVLAVRARPQKKRGATRNVWLLLGEVAPELAEWAAFFASCSDTRAAAEAGIARRVGRRAADDLLRQAEEFVGLVRDLVPVR